MKEKIAKVVSVVGTFASLFFSIKWMCESHFHYEPIITSIALLIAVFGQLLYWENKNDVRYLLNKSDGSDTQIDQVLNFTMYNYEISISPKQKGDYWRLGVKLSEDFNITLTRLTPQCPLYHLTQNFTSVLDTTYYNSGTINGGVQNSIAYDYKKEKIILKLSNNLHQLIIEVIKNGHTIQSQSLDKKFIYGKLLAWGDGQEYKIKVRVKRIPKF